MQPETIQVLSAAANVATIVGVFFGIMGLFFVWLQVKHAVLSRDATVCLNLAEFSNSATFGGALRVVLQTQPGMPLQKVDEAPCMEVCVFFELVGSVCNHGYTSTKLIEEFYGSLVVDVYGRLKDFIEARREQTGQSGFCANFESLAKRLRRA